MVIIGILSFFFGEIVVRKLKKSKKENTKVNEKSNNENITQQRKKRIWIIIYFIMIITFFFTIHEIKNICLNYGYKGNNFFEMLKYYRMKNDLLSGGNINAAYDLNFITKQLLKFCFVSTVFIEYFLSENIIAHKSYKINLFYIFGFILGLSCSLLTTGRSMFFHLIVSFLIMLLIMIEREKGPITPFLKKHSKLIIFIPIVCIMLLYFLLPILGRTNNGGMIESTSFSIGAHIPSLNKILRDTVDDEILRNKKLTFNNFYNFLANQGIIKNYIKPLNVWYRFGRYSSNTFTSLYAYYHDYGIFGVIILQMIFSIIINIIYIKAKKNNFELIIYSYFFYTIIDQIRGDQFYGLLTSSTIAYLLLIIILYYLLIYEGNYKNGNKKIKRI